MIVLYSCTFQLLIPELHNKNTLTDYCLFSCSGLANDHMKESFELKHELDGKMFPCHYIKIGEFC